jgi:hypothetical protein
MSFFVLPDFYAVFANTHFCFLWVSFYDLKYEFLINACNINLYVWVEVYVGFPYFVVVLWLCVVVWVCDVLFSYSSLPVAFPGIQRKLRHKLYITNV